MCGPLEVGGWYGIGREGGWLYLAKSIQVEAETPATRIYGGIGLGV